MAYRAFFEEIPHSLILKLIRRKFADEQFVTLLARLLKAGVIVDGVFEKITKGCPQGGKWRAFHLPSYEYLLVMQSIGLKPSSWRSVRPIDFA